ncbi:MFS transporter [Legionella sp. CNM-4043-24]|uniref:MFS transporter n=1 Tax=Legionella sp. CNM-4043-24 TaxID=3421646 RepID=UPI00403AD04A
MNQDEKRSVVAGLYGNALEWYDFMLYASFAPLFARYFFPLHVPFLSLLATFAVFAIGFLVRPLGGALLGQYADRSGRRRALIVSVSVMSLSTLGIALLPGYDTAGIVAPVLFVSLRLIQGLAVGGELPGSATFLIEHMPSDKRGFAGSLVLSTAFMGIFFGSFVASILSHFFNDDYLLSWGWRWAYLAGAALGAYGIYLRIHSVESSVFLKEKTGTDLPVKMLFSSHKINLLLAVVFTSIMAIGNYILVAYVTTFLVKSEGFPLRDVLTVNFLALLLMTIGIPFMGLLSDRVGRKRVFLAGLSGLILGIFPIFYLLISHNWWHVLWAELLLGLLLSPINATVPTLLAEMFPTAVRASGVSMGYNIGQAVFGGTVPLVALTLVEYTGNRMSPAWYILAVSLVVITLAFSLQKHWQKSLI